MLARKYFKIVSVLMFSNGKRIHNSIQNQAITPSHDIIEDHFGNPSHKSGEIHREPWGW